MNQKTPTKHFQTQVARDSGSAAGTASVKHSAQHGGQNSTQISTQISYVIYKDICYIIEEILAAGSLSCEELTLNQAQEQALPLFDGLNPLNFAREPVHQEAERLRRRSPLEIVRILRNRCAAAELHFFCALTYEAAHIFDDLELPKDNFAQFMVARAICYPIDEAFKILSAKHLEKGAQFSPGYELIANSSANFSKMFAQAREHMRVGDIFEIVLSRAFDFKPSEHAKRHAAFAHLSHQVLQLSAPYRFALDFPETQLVGASPELLVHVKDRVVTNRPISGSMRRIARQRVQANETDEKNAGAQAAAPTAPVAAQVLNDAELKELQSLYASEKEKSELDMLVDLARHDLHRVCDEVEVSKYREALVLETVVHTQSTVTGKLLEHYDELDAVYSCLNAGTLVGAPKKKAMEIILNLEGQPRRYYGGNLIHGLPDGTLYSTILIRTFQIDAQTEHLRLQAGATVLYESREDFEYWECGAKAKALLECVGYGALAEGAGPPPAIDATADASVAEFRFLKGFSELPPPPQQGVVGGIPDAKLGLGLRLVLIDNHDSFTFNLAALFRHFGCEIHVVRNDMPLPSRGVFDADGYILSPGPSAPKDAGNLLAITQCLWHVKPIFGVCLGFQAMVEALGGELGVMDKPFHGKARAIKRVDTEAELSRFLEGLPEKFVVARYHSLYGKVIPPGIRITAVDESNRPMALETARDEIPHCGVQFHPESFMSGVHGALIVRNWLTHVRAFVTKHNENPNTYEAQTESIVRAILRDEPSLPFLEKSLLSFSKTDQIPGKSLSAVVLANVVKELRFTGVCPELLLQMRTAIAGRAQQKKQAGRAHVFELCGTGGTQSLRLNTSTLTALFAASAGLCVVKHGGRSASGHKGSLDLLEALGLDLQKLYENCAESLRTTNLAFLGASFTYASFKRYAALRKEYGKPSIFNLLGPLLNPVVPSFRLVGTFDKFSFTLIAETLAELGESGFVVLGKDGQGFIDEVNPQGVTWVAEVKDRNITYKVLQPLVSLSKHLPLDRTQVFSDGIQSAHEVLGNTGTPQAELGLEFVFANLALLLIEESGAELNQINFQNTVAALWAQREHLCRKVSNLLDSLRTLEPADPRSPLAHEKPFAGTSRSMSRAQENFHSRCNVSNLNPRARVLNAKTKGLVIAEIKLRTPKINFTQALTLEQRIAAYTKGGADAISVVTHKHFDGSLELLRRIRSLTDLPLLAKDFLHTETQIDELCGAGADAVLILEDLLGTERSVALALHCLQKGALPVVESTNNTPLLQAFERVFQFPYLGLLNARNLFNLRIGTRFRQELAKHNPQVVLASDVATMLDGRLALRQNRGVLIGESLMKMHSEELIVSFLQGLKDQTFLLKACGAQNENEIQEALEAGANLVGINLVPESKRCINEEKFKDMLQSLDVAFSGDRFEKWQHICFLSSDTTHTKTPTIAAMLANLNPEIKRRVTEQTYGMCSLAGIKYLTAQKFSGEDFEATERLRVLQPVGGGNERIYGARFLLLDGRTPGSGHSSAYPDCPHALFHVPVLVAGGVTPANAHARIAEAHAKGWNVVGVDAASGVSRTTPPAKAQANTLGIGLDTEKIAQLRAALGGWGKFS